MKKTSQLPPDDSLLANSDTRSLTGQYSQDLPDPENDAITEMSVAEEMSDEDEEDDVATDSDVEDDGTPVLDEQDLEENGLSEDEVDDIEWEEPKTGE
jgi:hypothetical protein